MRTKQIMITTEMIPLRAIVGLTVRDRIRNKEKQYYFTNLLEDQQQLWKKTRELKIYSKHKISNIPYHFNDTPDINVLSDKEHLKYNIIPTSQSGFRTGSCATSLLAVNNDIFRQLMQCNSVTRLLN